MVLVGIFLTTLMSQKLRGVAIDSRGVQDYVLLLFSPHLTNTAWKPRGNIGGEDVLRSQREQKSNSETRSTWTREEGPKRERRLA